MKTLFLSISLISSTILMAQVAIGKSDVSSPSVSLDFGTGNRGFILPWVENTTSVTDAVNGALVYDASDHKVKVKLAAGWMDLSVDQTGTTVDPISGIDGLTLQEGLTDSADGKVGIGSETSTEGVLVLEDNTLAMVLPKVASPHLNIINPSPGMMVYDTTAKQLAVFNGKVWSFWKP